MNPNGIIFELNKREWFYLLQCGHHNVARISSEQKVYGPFPNSLIANAHMSNCHSTQRCRLIYQEDLKTFFLDEWADIQEKITYSRAHPQHSTPRGKNYGV